MATLYKQVDGEVTNLSGPVEFTVEPLRSGALEGNDPSEAAVFWRSYEDVSRSISAVQVTLGNALEKVQAMQKAVARTTSVPGDLDARLHDLRQDLMDLAEDLNGNPSKQQVGEKTKPTIGDRMFSVYRSLSNATYGPTQTNRKSMDIVREELKDIENGLQQHLNTMTALGKELMEAGAPWVEGNPLPEGSR